MIAASSKPSCIASVTMSGAMVPCPSAADPRKYYVETTHSNKATQAITSVQTSPCYVWVDSKGYHRRGGAKILDGVVRDEVKESCSLIVRRRRDS